MGKGALFWGNVIRSIGAVVVLCHVAAAEDPHALRALGWYAGKSEISDGQIKCEVPTTTTAIPDSTYVMGLWKTHGRPSVTFPDTQNGFADPCGGWLQIGSALTTTGMTLDRIALKMSLPGTRAAWHLVETRNTFPVGCRSLRRATIYAGARLSAADAPTGTTGSGAANVTFVRPLPIVSAALLECLRAQYAVVPTSVLASMSLVVRATVFAVDDTGKRYRSNPVALTLNLHHLCGNGRVDNGEACDPLSGDVNCRGVCVDGACRQAPTVACETAADCQGTCQPAGTSTECECAYS